MSDNFVTSRRPRRQFARFTWILPALMVLGLTPGCTDGEAQLVRDTSITTGGSLPDPVGASAVPGASGAGNSAGEPSQDRFTRVGGVARLPLFLRAIDHVLLISVDGLAARFLQQLLDEGGVPTFQQLKERGAFTHNARTDAEYTYTLPNHTSMLTSLPVMAPPGAPPEQGHGYTANSDPTSETTLHNSGNPARSYIPSVFDVVHDHGLRTAMFASKTKFSLYENSYNAAGAADVTGEDDGHEKIDVVEINVDITAMTNVLVDTLRSDPPNFTFVHYNQPDLTGHGTTWGSPDYLAAVQGVDRELERVLDTIEGEPQLAGRTALIVTADHGGSGSSHLDATNYENFVIPFYLFAPGAPGGRDLYSLVPGHRFAPPAEANPGYEKPYQPIRNGDAGNLALDLLRLPSIPGSLMFFFGLGEQVEDQVAAHP